MTMPLISTRTHGYMDYVVGIILIVAPYVLGFATGGPEQWVPMLLGAAAIVYSLLTRYKLGAIKLIPMRVHLGLDMASGVLLAVSPWLFGFSDRVFWPHLILGLIELGTALMTEREPAVQHR